VLNAKSPHGCGLFAYSEKRRSGLEKWVSPPSRVTPVRRRTELAD